MAPERGDRSLPAGTEGLPRVFLQSLRTLFDILDDRRRGYVHLREIESRWRGAEAQELPAGVMEGLRQAAPASGYLTFETFVLGLRAALPGTETPVEGGSGGRRSAEKPPSPRCSEERRGKSTGQREQGHGQPRGRGEWRDWTGGFGLSGMMAAPVPDPVSEVEMGSRDSSRPPVPSSGLRASGSRRAGVKGPKVSVGIDCFGFAELRFRCEYPSTAVHPGLRFPRDALGYL